MTTFFPLAQLYVARRSCSWMDGGIRRVESKSIRRDGIKQTTRHPGRRWMLNVDSSVYFPPVHSMNKVFLLKVTLSLIYGAHSFHVTRCCNSSKMQFFNRCMTITPSEVKVGERTKTEAFCKFLRIQVFSLDAPWNRFWSPTRIHCRLPVNIKQEWPRDAIRLLVLQSCRVCPQAGLEKKAKDSLRDFHRISAAKCLTCLRDSCCRLIEFRDSSFILVYCQHNRWQADESTPKN